MSFGQPLWLFALLLLPVLGGVFWRGQLRANGRLNGLVSPRLREQLISGVQPGRRLARFIIFLLGIAAAILALAEPRYGFADRNVQRIGRDVLIAIDTSKSMLANDTAPDRLTRSRLAALDLLDALPGDRAGLIAFAGQAFLQAPLTIDYSAVRESLNALDTNTIPQGGTDISGAIRAAVDAFGKSESNNRCLVIFSDGEDLTDDAVAAARSVAGKLRIFTVGVGTLEGSLLPVPNDNGGTDFVKDQDGNFVKSRLDETRLRQIAEATGGFYLHLGDSLADMKRLVTDGIAGVEEAKIDARLSRQPIERFQWPLGAALVLLALWHLIPEGRPRPLNSRVKATAAATLTLFILLNVMTHAADSADPMSLYRNGKYQDAYQAFQEHLAKRPNSPELQFNSGDSAFQAQQYQKAIDAFSGAMAAGDQLSAKSEYNLGSALFQRGLGQKEVDTKKKDWKNALQHLDSVLKSEPQNADAKFNRDAIQKALDDLDKKQEQQKQQDQQKKDDDKKSGQDKKDQQKSGGGKDQKDQKPQPDKGEKDQQKQPGEGKDQQPGQPGNQKSDDSKPQSGAGQSPSPSPTPGKGEQNEPQPGPSSSPTPAPDGALQAASPSPNPQGSPTPGEQGKTGTAHGAQGAPGTPDGSPTPGEMTAQQAAMLLDSLKGDEKNVPLNEHRPTGPVLKDW